MTAHADVVVIGAGPHGLAAIAHLRDAGVDVHAFGEPLDFWLRNMPEGMFLRSSYRACFISDPRRELTFGKYEASAGLMPEDGPVSIGRFVDYALWFQRSVAPDVDSRRVVRVEAAGQGFRLVLDDESTFEAKRVVVAAGIAPFAERPVAYLDLPPELVSHTSDHRTFTRFGGRRVLVVGAGQSALESAALLNEAGAETEVVARGERFRWIPPASAAARRRLPGAIKALRHRLHYLKSPPHDVGRLPWNWLVASPDVWQLIPRRYQPTVEDKVNYPRGASWLPARLVGVPLQAGIGVLRVTAVGDGSGLLVELSDGTERVVDHIVLGTGYRIDVARYGFLAPELLEAVRRRTGYPVLGRGLESSIPGLHFLGAPAALSFGPVMRFVTGGAYGARALTRRVLGRARRLVDFAW